MVGGADNHKKQNFAREFGKWQLFGALGGVRFQCRFQ